jgi:hypothetical protein
MILSRLSKPLLTAGVMATATIGSAGAAIVSYDESAHGDFATSDRLLKLKLGPGTHTVTGRTAADDPDPFAFIVDGGMELTALRLDVTGDTQASWTLRTGAAGRGGRALDTLSDTRLAQGGTVGPTLLPLGTGAYHLDFESAQGTPTYTFTFEVRPIQPMPEPPATALVAVALLGLGLSTRRRA